MRYDIIQELGRRMCGKTVVSVEAPHADEAVALFVMSDGSRVRLHATELGAWVEDTKVGELYESLDMLMRDYGHHRSHIGHDYGYQTPEPNTHVEQLRAGWVGTYGTFEEPGFWCAPKPIFVRREIPEGTVLGSNFPTEWKTVVEVRP